MANTKESEFLSDSEAMNRNWQIYLFTTEKRDGCNQKIQPESPEIKYRNKYQRRKDYRTLRSQC